MTIADCRLPICNWPLGNKELKVVHVYVVANRHFVATSQQWQKANRQLAFGNRQSLGSKAEAILERIDKAIDHVASVPGGV